MLNRSLSNYLKDLRVWAALAALLVFAHAAISFVYTRYNAPSRADFSATFETGDLSEWREAYMRQLCCDHSATITDEIARSGANAMKVVLKKSDPDVKKSKRSEFRLKTTRFGEERWYGFSTYIPEDWEEDPLPVTLVQWHGVADKLLFEEGRTPPLRIAVLGDKWAVVSHWSGDRVNQFPFGEFQADGFEAVWQGPLQKGQWVDWVFRIKWSYGADGEIDVWRNGAHAARRLGPNAYNDVYAPYLKVGLYVPDWKYPEKGGEVEEHTIFFDDVHERHGDGGADFFDVDYQRAKSAD